MTIANSTAVDDAVLERLAGDAALMALLPDGVWWGIAPLQATRVCLVSQLEHEDHYVMPGRVLYEQYVYLVQAVTRGADPTTAKAAAFRIDELLQFSTIEAAGYHPSMLCRRTTRLNPLPDLDDTTDERWCHAGAQYSVMITPL